MTATVGGRGTTGLLRSVDNREGGPEGEGGKGERKKEEEEERGRRRSGWERRQEQEEGAEGGERLRVPWRVSTRALHGMGGGRRPRGSRHNTQSNT